MSKFFKLDSSDFLKGLIVTVVTAVVAFLAQAMNVPGFSFDGFDWMEILRIAVMAGIGYLAKNLMTTADGQVLGVIDTNPKPKK